MLLMGYKWPRVKKKIFSQMYKDIFKNRNPICEYISLFFSSPFYSPRHMLLIIISVYILPSQHTYSPSYTASFRFVFPCLSFPPTFLLTHHSPVFTFSNVKKCGLEYTIRQKTPNNILSAFSSQLNF